MCKTVKWSLGQKLITVIGADRPLGRLIFDHSDNLIKKHAMASGRNSGLGADAHFPLQYHQIMLLLVWY
ncbi:hypothetical protein TH8_17990 [Thalassospira profundimaris]|nr:hypothetical protein TH8_17990 [Thalassospira profundimaris]